MDKTTAIVIGGISGLLIVGYVVVVALGHDGAALLGVLAGVLGGGAIHPAVSAVKSAGQG